MKIVEDTLKGILLISVIAVGVLFFYQKSVLKDSGVEREEVAEVKESEEKNEELVIMKDGFYQDNGLGYSFEYPSDWEINIEEPRTGRERQEQVVLEKDGAKIRIDPFGQRGADEFYYQTIEKEYVLLGDISWLHFYIVESEYHRFVNGGIKLKEDSTTEIVSSTGNIRSRGEFKVHLFFDDVSDEPQKEEALNVVKEIIDSFEFTETQKRWERLVNNHLGYAVIYPASWYLDYREEDPPGTSGHFSTQDYLMNQDVGAPLEMTNEGVWITIDRFDLGNDFKEQISELQDRHIILESVELNIGGFDAVRQIETNPPDFEGENGYFVVYYIKTDDYLYRFFTLTFSRNTYEDNKYIIRGIVDSFKLN